MKFYVLPYKAASRSAKALATALETKRLKLVGSRFRGGPNKTVINWGNQEQVAALVASGVKVLNPDPSVASNKLTAFNTIAAFNRVVANTVERDDLFMVEIPEFTQEQAVAEQWRTEGHTVVERHLLRADSGRGIRIVEADSGELITAAPLYTKYVKKRKEYRIHIVNDRVILKQQKVLRQDADRETANWKVRNHDGGFIFQQNDIQVDGLVIDQAKQAIKALKLDFGAVDVLWNDREGKATVIEVNTAPGLAGTTPEKYAQAFLLDTTQN